VVRRLAFAVPGDIETATGGYAYDRRIIAELKDLGWRVDVVSLGGGFPRPDERTRAAAGGILAQVPEGCPIVVDGLALGVLPEAAARVSGRNPLIALVHHPLALESGLPRAEADDFRNSERAALAQARRVIVTSAATGKTLSADYGVPAGHIAVARPGNDAVAQARGSGDGIVRLIAVGSLVPRKGHDVLIAALQTLRELPWRLTIAGNAELDPHTAEKIKRQIAASGLAERISLVGVVTAEALATLYVQSDLFALASRFEGYGMAYTEAIAHGLPVIGTTGGAIPEAVPAGAGLLVEPGDVNALAGALRRLISNNDERRIFAGAARAAATRLPAWRDSAKIFAATIEAAT
jgi:glycosyltransferase involved in cell wall biosynthesis